MKRFTDETIYICKDCYAELIEDEIVKYNKGKQWICPYCRGTNIEPITN